MTLQKGYQWNSKLDCIIFGAVSNFLETYAQSKTFTFPQLNNLWPRICTKHIIFYKRSNYLCSEVDKDASADMPIIVHQIMVL